MAIIKCCALVNARVDALYELGRLRGITIIKHKTGTRWITSVNFINRPLLLFININANIHNNSCTETKSEHHNIFVISHRHDFPLQYVGDLPKPAAQIRIRSFSVERIVHENDTISTKVEKFPDHIVDPCRVGTLQPSVSYNRNVAILPATTVGNAIILKWCDATLRVSANKAKRELIEHNFLLNWKKSTLTFERKLQNWFDFRLNFDDFPHLKREWSNRKLSWSSLHWHQTLSTDIWKWKNFHEAKTEYRKNFENMEIIRNLQIYLLNNKWRKSTSDIVIFR